MKTITEHIAFLKYFVDKGGPTREEYQEMKDWMIEVGEGIEKSLFTKEEIEQFYNTIGSSFPVECINGMIYHKPRRYSGDFELLNRIQTKYISQNSQLKNWDEYFHFCEAPQAVRFRSQYLNQILENKVLPNDDKYCMLNIASGSCRDIYDYYKRHPESSLAIECVEHDKDAIEFAMDLLKEIDKTALFFNSNVWRFQFAKKYDLVWSAGLFDYLDDDIFIRVLNRIINNVKKGGEIIIGNLSVSNPTKYYMLLVKWIVFHRTEEQLEQLAIKAGAEKERISIYKESLDVNLFLHIRI